MTPCLDKAKAVDIKAEAKEAAVRPLPVAADDLEDREGFELVEEEEVQARAEDITAAGRHAAVKAKQQIQELYDTVTRTHNSYLVGRAISVLATGEDVLPRLAEGEAHLEKGKNYGKKALETPIAMYLQQSLRSAEDIEKEQKAEIEKRKKMYKARQKELKEASKKREEEEKRKIEEKEKQDAKDKAEKESEEKTRQAASGVGQEMEMSCKAASLPRV